jgi:hypothetical protein
MPASFSNHRSEVAKSVRSGLAKYGDDTLPGIGKSVGLRDAEPDGTWRMTSFRLVFAGLDGKQHELRRAKDGLRHGLPCVPRHRRSRQASVGPRWGTS